MLLASFSEFGAPGVTGIELGGGGPPVGPPCCSLAALLPLKLTTDTFSSSLPLKSITDTSIMGAMNAVPVKYPAKSGITVAEAV